MEKDLYSFVFKGLLTQASLDRTEIIKPFVSELDPIVADRLSLELLDESLVIRAKRMATVYTVIAAFENTVRDFLTRILLESFGESWWDAAVSEKIRNRAFSRREEENKVRWHTPRGDSLINYTDFGDLTSIIQQNWVLFEAHLHSIEWVRQIIITLERSRNVIMHSGELQNEDIERIGSSIRDWIRQVG